MKGLKRDIPKSNCCWGDGDIKGVKTQIEELGIIDNVVVLGWVVGKNKNKLFNKSDIILLPSYFEALPMSIFEAIAAGLPIISTPVGGIPEIVTEGLEGFLVDPGDIDNLINRISRLLENPELQARMGNASIRKVQSTFAAEVVVPQIEEIYSDIIEGTSN